MQNRGRLPETDDEAIEDIRDHMGDSADHYIQAYTQLRANGATPSQAALQSMTAGLNSARMKLAGLLDRN